MKRRYTIWTAVVIAFALLAAACGGDSESTDTTVASETTVATETTVVTETTVAPETTTTGALPPLVVWADEKRAPVIEAIAPEFTEATGVEVIVTLVANEDMQAEVETKGPAGEGPDIFIGAHDWVGGLASNGAPEAGAVAIDAAGSLMKDEITIVVRFQS